MRRAVVVALAAAVAWTAGCTEGRSERTSGPTPSIDLRWARGADMPTPRTEIAAAGLGGKVYVAGGFTGEGRATDVVEVYDPETDAWASSVPLPEPRHHAGLAAAGGRLYLVGGYTAAGDASANVWSWAPGDESWTDVPPLRVPRGALAVTVATNRRPEPTTIHAIGGATGFRGDVRLSGAHEALRLGDRRWEEFPELPRPRDHVAASTIPSGPRDADDPAEIVVVGGRELSLTQNRAYADRYDVRRRLWNRLPDLPTARGGLAAAALDFDLFVFGGEEQKGTFEQTEFFHRTSSTWHTGPPLPTARHGLAAVVLTDPTGPSTRFRRVFVIGGGPTPGLSVSGATEILEVSA